MNSGNQNTEKQHAGINKPKKKWPKWTIAGAIPVTALLVGILADSSTLWTNIFGSSDSQSAVTQGQASQSSPATQASATTPSEADNTLSSLSSGDFGEGCFLDEQGNLKRIACDSPHNAEIFESAQSCNQQTLVKYLGGVPGVDVLRQGLEITEVSGKGCMLTLPPEIQLTTTSAMFLASKNSEFMRLCYDAKTNSDVGCDEIHTAEVVKTYAPESTEMANCLEAAERYLGISRTYFTAQLTVEPQDSNDSRRCMVAAKGDNILTATLRDISNSSLPIAADDGIRN
ncbi:hypothetical protein SLW73_02060 [Glutamicibacter protophormiae]|uniref:hypothetical protein n=1 Tax=Glutamicibacter protophormiae TaxID=37930 RepID=UPI002A83EC0B|nr:hypothetical protein [Glutamicibacter protophormiae]WPR65145.1 hypothetical protein SLW72_02060 [Glutamicibacter protophormiae]WPR68642.1 hypothetical protein SLW73_02060 [Glutamicibacter protophormiae]